ncbi:MAG: hypothetical protein OXH95_08080 [bacterium]|nr:hypothetical protein [bacterium]MCY3653377.1 hypothetical protein [bacterium]MDE0644066.1 hypothetical protein [bacterium]MYD05214.1 hypothetical protein [Acidimicrobiia bacterium]MYH54993.1 hypothetical protein [Acidimicrobiia bacterium]
MVEIPEHLLLRSAEAKAKALGIPVEQVLAEMRGEAPPVAPAAPPPSAPPSDPAPTAPTATTESPAAPVAETPASPSPPAPTPPAPETTTVSVETPPTEPLTAPSSPPPPASENGERATQVTLRPVAPPEEIPEGVRPQRLLTVVKAKAIQQVKATPTDKVNTWPHLMIAEFSALMVVTAVLIVISVILQAPLLELANFNATPNPSKAPWYFLGLQELLSYYDPQIAGVIIPTITGLLGFMAIPYVDRNPSTKPSDRKFAIMLFTLFLTGSATLTLIGTLFRGPGFNFTYPWADGIWFDDLKDWVHFE